MLYTVSAGVTWRRWVVITHSRQVTDGCLPRSDRSRHASACDQQQHDLHVNVTHVSAPALHLRTFTPFSFCK